MEAQWSHYARVTVGKNLSAHFWHNSQPEHANCPHTLTKLIGASVGSAVGSAVANAHSSSVHISQPEHAYLSQTFSLPSSSFPLFANLSYTSWHLSSQGPVGAGVGNSSSQKEQPAQNAFAQAFW